MMFLGLNNNTEYYKLKSTGSDLDRVWSDPEPYRERVATTPFTPMERFFFTAMAARGASQKFPEVAANTCSAIEMQQNKPFATHF